MKYFPFLPYHAVNKLVCYITYISCFLLFSEGLSEEEALALQNKLDSFYTIMNQEMEVLKEQSRKVQREKDITNCERIFSGNMCISLSHMM